MKKVFFTLCSARSGTLSLRHLFQKNVPGCACRHEPFFDWGNPTMFGRAIYDAYAGRIDSIRDRLARKRAYIEKLPGHSYLESSHAFLKSAYTAALEFFPGMFLVHLVRDPFQVAASEAYRQQWRERVRAPFHFYTGDDHRRHFVWALTGNEEIFRHFDGLPLTLFQWYVIQWIEIENRAIRFLEEHALRSRCVTLPTPKLNDPASIRSMFDFLGLSYVREPIVLTRAWNRSFGYSSAPREQLEEQFNVVLERIAPGYLRIFQEEPYTGFPGCAKLTAPYSSGSLAGFARASAS